MKSSEVLDKASNLAWTQGAFARASDNKIVAVSSDRACSYCSVGRVIKIIKSSSLSYEERRLLEERCLNYLSLAIGNEVGIDIWNDTPGRTLVDVSEAFSRAISKAKELGD